MAMPFSRKSKKTPTNEGESANITSGRQSSTGETRAALKGALIGSVSAILISAFLFSGQPAKASATLLLPSLGTIISSITTYYNLMQQYVEQWSTLTEGIFDRNILNEFPQEHRQANGALRTASEGHAGYHAKGDDELITSVNVLNDLVRKDGEIDMVAAAEYLLPPMPKEGGNLSEADLNQIRDYSLIMTQDQPIPQPNGWIEGTSAGALSEYRRLNVIQQRLLSQDAITQYPMHSSKMHGYNAYLDSVQSSSASGSLTPGQLLSTQLSVMADVAVPVAMDSLASDLRRERLLGAQLATMANDYYETEGRRLAEQGQ